MSQSATHDRPQVPILTFSVEGLSAREELLVKTFVRLLKLRTLHEWHYQAQPADLRMVAEGVLSKNLAALSGEQQQALVLGSLPGTRPNYLCMPLRADELQQELNRVGALIVAARQTQLPSALDWVTHPVQLTRWPQADLVATPQRLRMATLLTGKPLTLEQLQLRSGQTQEQCILCLTDFGRAGLLRGRQAAVGTPSTAAMTTNALPIAKPAAHTPLALGLLARIRNRLGLLSTK